ncbi:hypothetical protein DFJ58DRAFT_845920 [Suillus subalutaceus]|uniref:uncharacterized protein n=1 Tax=Suillus subalutaceus TaxID=48586 RepID=UPI001B879C00|nr:uncharacterized protein DFJ58DRAFT_845920 [Suillus subalutaceus]KAG1838797.1 hypothetical protein DFJ58DRAFT_845920 [Suillus subalutaceus]
MPDQMATRKLHYCLWFGEHFACPQLTSGAIINYGSLDITATRYDVLVCAGRLSWEIPHSSETRFMRQDTVVTKYNINYDITPALVYHQDILENAYNLADVDARKAHDTLVPQKSPLELTERSRSLPPQARTSSLNARAELGAFRVVSAIEYSAIAPQSLRLRSFKLSVDPKSQGSARWRMSIARANIAVYRLNLRPNRYMLVLFRMSYRFEDIQTPVSLLPRLYPVHPAADTIDISASSGDFGHVDQYDQQAHPVAQAHVWQRVFTPWRAQESRGDVLLGRKHDRFRPHFVSRTTFGIEAHTCDGAECDVVASELPAPITVKPLNAGIEVKFLPHAVPHVTSVPQITRDSGQGRSRVAVQESALERELIQENRVAVTAASQTTSTGTPRRESTRSRMDRSQVQYHAIFETHHTFTIAESLPLTGERRKEPYGQDVVRDKPSEVSSPPKLEGGEEYISIDRKLQTVEAREDHHEKGTESEVKSNLTSYSHSVRIVEGHTPKSTMLNDDRQMNEGADGAALSLSYINPGSKASPSHATPFEFFTLQRTSFSERGVPQDSGTNHTESEYERRSSDVDIVSKSSIQMSGHDSTESSEGRIQRHTPNDYVEHDEVPVSGAKIWRAEELSCTGGGDAAESLGRSESAMVSNADGRSDVDTDSNISSLPSTYAGRQLSPCDSGVPQDAGINYIQSAREHQFSEINVASATLVQTSNHRLIENRVQSSLVTIQGGQDAATGQPCQRSSAAKLDSNELAECAQQAVEGGGGRHELEMESEFKLSATAHCHSVKIAERSASGTVGRAF